MVLMRVNPRILHKMGHVSDLKHVMIVKILVRLLASEGSCLEKGCLGDKGRPDGSLLDDGKNVGALSLSYS